MSIVFLLAAFLIGAALGSLVTAWIQNRPRKISPEFRECINRIFEGSEAQKKGRVWLEREMSDSSYEGSTEGNLCHKHHEMIHEPEDGAELDCFWNAKYKIWEPIHSWPDVLQPVNN
jgi:hypothetical protein